jgi:hypothetical protein
VNAPLRIFPCNWDTLNVWCALWNQWRVLPGQDGKAVRLGLDWGQAESALRLAGIHRRKWPQIFDGLQAMENQAILIFGGAPNNKNSFLLNPPRPSAENAT